MIRLFKHYVPYAVLFLALVDLCLLVAAAETAWVIRANQIGMHVDYIVNRIWPLLTFSASVQLAAMAVGVYSAEALQSLRFAIARLLVAVSLGVIFMAIMAFALPGMTLWRSNSLYAMIDYIETLTDLVKREIKAGGDENKVMNIPIPEKFSDYLLSNFYKINLRFLYRKLSLEKERL